MENKEKNKGGRPQIFNEQFCQSEVNSMLEYLNTDDGKDILFIGELCLMRGYSFQRWSDRMKSFKENHELMDTIEKIEQTLEIRLSKGMVTNKYSANGAKFTLINKYGWRDKQEIEHANNPDNPFNNQDLSKLSTEQLKAYLEFEKIVTKKD